MDTESQQEYQKMRDQWRRDRQRREGIDQHVERLRNHFRKCKEERDFVTAVRLLKTVARKEDFEALCKRHKLIAGSAAGVEAISALWAASMPAMSLDFLTMMADMVFGSPEQTFNPAPR